MGPATAVAIETAGQLHVESISDYPSFLSLEPVWTDLADHAGIDHPFLSFDWVRTWWECFGAGKELHILTVHAGRDLIAIAPLMLAQGWMDGFRLRRLQCIYNDHTPRCDFIIARRPQEVYRAIWTYLLEHRALWATIELRQLPAGSRTLEALSRLAVQDGFLVGLWPSSDSPYLPVRGAWDGYLNSLSRKHRLNMRNRLRRIRQLGQAELEQICSSEQVESALEEGLRIEAAAWKGKAGSAILSQSDLYPFYKRLAERTGERGWLRLQLSR